MADLLHLFLAHWRAALAALAVVTAAVYLLGRHSAPEPAWSTWGGTVGMNTLWQARICWKMEAAPRLSDAVDQFLPGLAASVLANGILWGVFPILVSHASHEALTAAVLCDAMLMFCVATAPATRTLNWIPVPPVAVLGAVAIAMNGESLVYSLGYVTILAVIVTFGLKLNSSLSVALMARREAEDLASQLRDHQERLIESERRETLLLERERLTRDMHDGIGSTLVSCLAAVSRGTLPDLQVRTMLQECIDDLRLVIASLEPGANDMAALLASSRKALQRNVDAGGLQLEWNMGDLPALDWIQPSQSLQILRILQEAVSNSIRHSGATHVRVECRQVDDEEVVIAVSDDGRGFDLEGPHEGRGLPSIARRTRLLEARMDIQSSAGKGTIIRLTLPIRKPCATQAQPKQDSQDRTGGLIAHPAAFSEARPGAPASPRAGARRS